MPSNFNMRFTKTLRLWADHLKIVPDSPLRGPLLEYGGSNDPWIRMSNLKDTLCVPIWKDMSNKFRDCDTRFWVSEEFRNNILYLSRSIEEDEVAFSMFSWSTHTHTHTHT